MFFFLLSVLVRWLNVLVGLLSSFFPLQQNRLLNCLFDVQVIFVARSLYSISVYFLHEIIATFYCSISKKELANLLTRKWKTNQKFNRRDEKKVINDVWVGHINWMYDSVFYPSLCHSTNDKRCWFVWSNPILNHIGYCILRPSGNES